MILKKYSYKMGNKMNHFESTKRFKCSKCSKLFIRFFVDPPKRTRLKGWTCSSCNGIKPVTNSEQKMGSKLAIDLGGLTSEARCGNCKHFVDCPGSNQWWKKCDKGYVSPQIFDDDTEMTLVYFEDACPGFESKDSDG